MKNDIPNIFLSAYFIITWYTFFIKNKQSCVIIKILNIICKMLYRLPAELQSLVF